LVYLCVVLTPFPTAAAQTTRRPGEFPEATPSEVIVVGWRPAKEDRVAVTVAESVRIPVQVQDSVPLKITGDVRVNGAVQTKQDANTADRVVLVGWEENSVAGRPGVPRMLNPDPNARFVAMPVMTIPPR
jgi:hypothetical protein